MNSMFRFSAVCSAMLAVAPLQAAVTFVQIPGAGSANDMTPDGRFVVGDSNQGPYIYDTLLESMIILPGPAAAVAISDDGKVVLGNIADPNTGTQVAAIWKEATNQWTSLGTFPGATTCGSATSGYELNGDGTVATGLAWINGCSGVGFRWTESDGMAPLQSLANGSNRSSVISANGSVLGGFAQGSFSRTPAFWSANGAGTLLDPPSGNALGEVHGINDAGTILLGNWNGAAVTWTAGGTVRTTIGNGSYLPGWQGVPLDIANSGTIVGFDFLQGARRAWIRSGSSGPIVDLKTYIEANGGTVPSGVVLEVCQAISTDGSKICGHSFGVGGWLVTIESDVICAGDIAPEGGNGIVDGADLGVLLSLWGTPDGDLNRDGETDGSDLGVLLAAWGACPTSGACCSGSDCAQLSPGDCAAIGGTYLGDGVPCGLLACANNDHCADAIDVTENVDGPAVLGDNSTATPPKFGGLDPEFPNFSPSCQWNGNRAEAHSSVWFKFAAPESGSFFVETCDSIPAPFVDSLVTIYSGECGSLVEVSCAEDGCGFSEYPYYSNGFAFGFEPGQTVYVCVMNAGGWNGSNPGPFALLITTYDK